jgi:membrane protein
MRAKETDHWTIETLMASLIPLRWVPAPVVAVAMAPVRFFYHQCIQWAAALAYYTLIGLVPLLTALFALMKGVGLHREVTPYIVSTVGAGSRAVAAQIVQFIDATNVRAVGALSALAAVLASFGIMGNAEMCFNAIWGGVPGRPLKRKLRSYALVLVVAPLLFLLTLAMTALIRRGSQVYVFFDSLYLGNLLLIALRVLPYALLWLSFTILYNRLPNTEVRPMSAVVGAVVAGTLWQMAQWAYVTFVIRMVRYSAVYGALWQLPILLAWIYVAWSVILFGAEVARAHQEVVGQRLTRPQIVPRTPDTVRAE